MMHLFIAAALAATGLGGTTHRSGASKPTPAATAVPSRNAPADEYYGHLHMSALRLRQRIDQLAGRYNGRTESDDDIVHDAGDLRDAMRIWIARYPHDIWAAPTAYHLAQLYTLVQSEQARAAARDAFRYVATTFPGTTFAHNAALRLAKGFPALHSESPVVASPQPGASLAAPPSASALPSPAPSAASTVPPGTTGSPAPATASPVPSTAAAPVPSSPR